MNHFLVKRLAVLGLALFAFSFSACSSSGGGGGNKLTELKVTPSPQSITKGETQQFTATGTFSDGTEQDMTSQVTWSSSDTAIATISGAGLAAGISQGNATITATAENVNGTASLTVTQLPAITGKVLDFTTGAGVPNASVSTGNITTTTGADGSFTLPDVPVAERTLVMVSASDFAGQSRVVRLSAGMVSIRLNISLLPVSVSQVFDPTLLQNLIDPASSAQATINGNSLVGSDGLPPSGNVTGRLTVIDPSGNPDILPGDFTEFFNNLIRVLESYGAIQVNFSDDQGNAFDLFSGATSTIRIPVAQGVTNAPATVSLYFFDEASGRWVASNQTATLDLSGTFYEGNVTSFTSTWSASEPFSTVTVNGCVKDADGNPLAGVTVHAQGGDYIGASTATTNPDGSFSISVKQNARAFLFAENTDGSKSNTIEVNPGSVDVTLTDCLAFGQQATSIKLTWGGTPADLDAHLVGPADLHIYWSNKGVLGASPFTQLDVDDIAGFGPEITTIEKFEAGTYTYSVSNFSGTPSISGSPTRVELNLNGVVHLFTPPSGEGINLTWNVFELVVDANQNITLNRLDTWTLGILG